MDRFEKELDNCFKLAHDPKDKEDREFWQQAPQRWKSLLEHYEEQRPAGTPDRETRREI